MFAPKPLVLTQFNSPSYKMRHINGDRRRHVLSLSKRVEELLTTRRKLIAGLQDLDAQVKSMRHERNALHNLDAPTSNIPDEVLAMIFEAGMHLEKDSRVHFGTLVSQISHRWRSIALTTQRLWIYIPIGALQPSTSQVHPSESQGWRDRASLHLSRSRPLPVDIHIKYLMADDLAHQFCPNSIFGHLMKRCHRLFIDPSIEFMPRLLDYLSCHHMPLLSWISLSCTQEDEDDDEYIEFEGPFFPLGSPALRTVHLDTIDITSLPSCLLDMSSVTSLRLTNLPINCHRRYALFRDGLTSLKALSHLELEFEYFGWTPADVSPVVLPTLQFLRLNFEYCDTDIIGLFRADLLISLSLVSLSPKGWSDPPQASALVAPHFPSLRHLILVNYDNAGSLKSPYDWLATTFPDIERLTFSVDDGFHNPNFNDMFAAIQWDEEGPEDASEDMRWKGLEIIAISDIQLTNPANVQQMCYILTQMQDHGCPIRELLIPPACVAHADAESMVKLEGIVKIANFKVNWPTPFERQF
ncbi:hypothetical protein FIBSPDRAFT_944271 [Athelia psychrophila]|uniref:Uncharacterized protein n=1 Tax=Athelia psychrophila TaxID=1759441 RepID=A0A166UZQ5_9AGAM|nr:hypothetical protein FIBSPDRAFT_944271 [Fibularhizoctonia sp. CBS 109695]